jgi:transposase-like protein
VFPRSLRQRCLAHKIRNLQSKVPEEVWREVKGAALAAYQAGSPKLARIAKEDFVARYEREFPSATACFLDDFEACIAHLQLPIAHRRATRTTNLLERLFGEERRRTEVSPHAFGERAVLELMYASADSRQRHLEADRDLGVRAQTTREPARAPEPCSRRAHRTRREERIPLTNFQQG